MFRFTFLVLFTSAIFALGGQSPADSTFIDSDSVFTADTIAPVDSSTALSSPADSNTAAVAHADSSVKPKLPVAPADSSQQKKLTPTKHVYDHKHMVYLAMGMMAFIAILFSTTQMWNPK